MNVKHKKKILGRLSVRRGRGGNSPFGKPEIQVIKTLESQWRLSEVFNAHFLDVGLLDLVRKLCRAVCWLVNHSNGTAENVNLFGSSLS